MGGRKNRKDEKGEQTAKPRNAGGRGFGFHHRAPDRRSGAPRPIASGRKRSDLNSRDQTWRNRDDEEIEDLAFQEKPAKLFERLEETEEAANRGACLDGLSAVGIVTALRRGGCLVIPTRRPQLPPNAPPLPDELFVRPRGLLKQFDLGVSAPVAVGDEIEFVIPPVGGDETYEGLLTRTYPRGSEFRRLHPSSQALQTLAANIARVAVVASADQPPFRPGFVDRVWVCALASNIPLLLILNKCDLGVRKEDEDLLRLYAELGLPSVCVSAKTGENLSDLAAWLTGERQLPAPADILDKFSPTQPCNAPQEPFADERPPPVPDKDTRSVRALVPSNRTLFCGHSGVGKSSLLTALAPVLRDCVAIGEIVHKTGKGAHTTTQVDMYDLPDPRPGCVGRLVVIDTPGVREFTPVDTDRRNLWGWFPEIRALQGYCRFSDCAHITESGCAVLAAMAERKIHPRRHESYVRLYKTLPG